MNHIIKSGIGTVNKSARSWGEYTPYIFSLKTITRSDGCQTRPLSYETTWRRAARLAGTRRRRRLRDSDLAQVDGDLCFMTDPEIGLECRLLKRPVPFDAHRDVEYLAVGGDDHVPLIVKAKPDQPYSRDDDFRLGIGRDPDDAAMAPAARADIQIPALIKSHS